MRFAFASRRNYSFGRFFQLLHGALVHFQLMLFFSILYSLVIITRSLKYENL